MVFFLLDDELLPVDESSIDALVSDSYPLDFGSPAFGHAHPTTPAVPPGLGITPALAQAQLGEAGAVIRPPSTQQGTAVVRPPPPAVPRPVTPLTPLGLMATPKKSAKAEVTPATTDARKNIKELAVESGLSQDIAAQSSSTPPGKAVLQEEDFPALHSVKASPTKAAAAVSSKPASSAKAPPPKKATAEPSTKAAAPKPPAKADKRPTPSALDIAAATKAAAPVKDAPATSDAAKTTEPVTSASGSAPKPYASAVPTPTTTTASVSSPLTRAAPKTIRLVQTPKTELPPSIPPAAASSIRAAALSAGAHRPGTPASEAISDSASVISASVSASRTSSPPPTKIGSASVRVTTKSQQRKQRKEASKEATSAIIEEAKPPEKEVEIAPILGRKKKQKKEKKPKPSNTASPATSRPATPVAAPAAEAAPPATGTADKATAVGDEKLAPKDKVAKKPTTESPAKVKDVRGRQEAKSPPRSPGPVDTSIRLNESTKTTVLTPDYVTATPEPRPEPVYEGAVGEVPSLPEILQSLIEEGELPDPDDLSLFKASPPSRLDMDKQLPNSLPPTVKSVVSKEDEAELAAFRPVRKVVNGHRVLLTPNGDFILNLTEEEEQRFLELQARVAQSSSFPTAFSHPKYNTPVAGFSLINGRAVPNGLPSFFPAAPGSFPQDPVGKMHREEAIGCINQHVLPSLNLGSYKPNSSFPNGSPASLQALAPWLSPRFARGGSGRESSFDAGGGHHHHAGGIAPSTMAADGSVFPHVHSGDSPHENWDDEDEDGMGGEGGASSPAIGSTPLMSIDEAEQVLAAAKKQHETTDKKFRQSMARLRRQFGLH